jgi:hypothetical protein
VQRRNPPSRSKKLFSLSCLSISLSLAILCLYPYLSLSFVFVTTGIAAFCLPLSPLLVLLAPKKLFFLLVLLAAFWSHSLACPPRSKFLLNAFRFFTPSIFYLLFLYLRLCSDLSGNTTTAYPVCYTLSVETTIHHPLDTLYSTCQYYNRTSTLLSLAALQATMLCALLRHE